ncbi:hypothetical protein [Acidovorax sp. NCPPB 4044]|uniref:hypothetical protein n=1 Tax=Acidovorax sp. NCPPB 4044 TaxID=2940490 RepID=UPI0023047C71|nr:hypothetical protein [Acidovorax sp. NCPPB 4044]MDA8519197.1 hypothetical protein [Acidovorax sp. NCPPB 4044]
MSRNSCGAPCVSTMGTAQSRPSAAASTWKMRSQRGTTTASGSAVSRRKRRCIVHSTPAKTRNAPHHASIGPGAAPLRACIQVSTPGMTIAGISEAPPRDASECISRRRTARSSPALDASASAAGSVCHASG